MHVSSLWIFPVKSFRGAAHATARILPWGLEGDRRWMLATPEGACLTQREYPRMALIQAQNHEDGVVFISPSGSRMFAEFPRPDAATLAVMIWGDTVPARVADDAANAWLGAELGADCRLVHMADMAARPIDPRYARPDETVSFADGFPLLIATQSSLDDLNARLASPITMLRFRPNLVIEGAPAWDEDSWHLIRAGEAIFEIAKPCDRCVLTTIDPETGQKPDPREPLRTLAQFRRDVRNKVIFGQNVIPRRLGIVRVGDEVEILARGVSNVVLKAAE